MASGRCTYSHWYAVMLAILSSRLLFPTHHKQPIFDYIQVCIGAGVLAIPQAVAYWGWVGGMMLLVFFSVVMYVVSHLLTYAIKHEDQRFRSYTSAVLHICGHNHALGVATIQYTYMAAATVQCWIVAL